MGTTTHLKIKKMSPQLLVEDIDRSIDFYTKKLGFDIDFRYQDFYVGISKDGYSIHLKSGNSPIDKRKNRGTDVDLDILFSVIGIDDLYREILKESVEIVQPVRDMPYGREFYIADPDNNLIAFTEEA
jgi:predicted enzyme related to lactoylglutathione lyase